jgi:hypothetical protein
MALKEHALNVEAREAIHKAVLEGMLTADTERIAWEGLPEEEIRRRREKEMQRTIAIAVQREQEEAQARKKRKRK